MRYLVVKNWQQHQHYKKRSPPWIKLHRAVIEDYAFGALEDAAKAHLMLLWVLAASTDGRLPHDAAFLAKRIGAAGKVNLEALIAAGFLLQEEGEPEALDGLETGQKASANIHKRANGDDTPIVERIPMIGGEEYEVHQSLVDELARLYVGVDVPATLREIRGWCLGNPQKLKTPAGIRRFITGWMQREQNHA